MLCCLRSFVVLLLCVLGSFPGVSLAGQLPASKTPQCFQLRTKIKTSAWLTGIYFSPDGRFVTQSGRKKLKVWDVSSGELYKEYLGNDDRISAVTFSSDGSRIAAGDKGSFAWVWEVQTGKLVAKFETKHNDEVGEIALSPDGRLLVTHGMGGCYWTNTCNRKVLLWDVDRGKVKATLLLPHIDDDVMFYDLDFTRDGKTVVTVLESKAALWDAATGGLRAKLIDTQRKNNIYEVAGDSPRDIAVSPDNKTLAVLTFQTAEVMLWDLETGALIDNLDRLVDDEPLRSIGFSSDGRFLALGGEHLTLFDVRERRVINQFREEHGLIKFVSFSPDTAMVAAADDRNTYVWNVADGKLKEKLVKASQATFSPDGRTLATFYDERLSLWAVSCR